MKPTPQGETNQVREIIPIGTSTSLGKVAGVLWIGERYYFLIKGGVVSLLPASYVELLINTN